MRNQLIVQFRMDEMTFDQMIEIEDTLIQAFRQNNCAIVDGHDIGSGTINIFIIPRGAWRPVIERVLAFLELRQVLSKAVIAKQFKVSEKFKVIWPEGYQGEFVV